MIEKWNDTARDYPSGKCLHVFFEEQAKCNPDNIALEFRDVRLTYEELNQRANKLAHFLRKKGVKDEVRVGVCCERSVEMVISLYAVLKAGGAYVPLDPDYPDVRLAFMIEEIEAPIILTQSHLSHKIPRGAAGIVCLDTEWDKIFIESDENPVMLNKPDNLAYIIYTSGSTGKPKGVMNQHNGIVNRLLWMQEEYQLTESDVVLQKTPYSFDVSVWEFFWPLMFGAKLIVAEPGGHQDVNYLSNLIKNKAVTTLHFVPSMLQIFVDKAELAQCRSVRQVFCSGEALPYELQKQFLTYMDANLHNLYGPTEAAVDVTYWKCDSSYPRKIVPIGRPVANTQIYILDKNLNTLPVGTSGELHIGGVQVARGYLNRKKLTDEKFIADPFSNISGAKLYKTGDLVRQLSDGAIEYIGRIDFQVKIRGLRIELGEIESRMAEIEGIKQCVVIVREDKPGDKRIVAYYESKDDEILGVEEMRKKLDLGLPSYMVPQYFVQMNAFPLSPNGKIDRKSLPKPSADDFKSTEHFVAPESDIEKKLAKIWSELLGVEGISVYDKFIELGGHSMLVLEAVLKVKEVMSIDLDPAAVIRDTLEQIAAGIEGDGAVERAIDEAHKVINYEPYFFGGDSSLFGVYQWPSRRVEERGAVLLCSPIYLESLNIHLSYRYLSAKLSDVGYHVLRFDYYGSGDSLGDDQEAHVERWQEDIRVAVKELKQRSGCNCISMIGFRFGAALAALSIPEKIDRLILWEPVVSGKSYVEALERKYHSTLDKLNYIRKHNAKDQPEEIIGFSFPENTKNSLEKVNLFDSEHFTQCKKIVAITSNDQSEIQLFKEQFNHIGGNTEFCFVEDSIQPIETYTDMKVYLPGKSLNLVVDKVKGKA